MTPFHTVKEASQLTGKSPSSIRRIIYPIIHDDEHTDRGHVQPSASEATELRMKGENFAWRLSEELLRREIPVEVRVQKGNGESPPTTSSGTAETELLAMLRRELEIKNQQIMQQAELIAKQMELVNGLGQRIQEGNFLIASLQRHLALPDGRPPTDSQEAKTKRATSPRTGKGSTIAPKSAKPKKGFFARFFR